MAFAVGKAQSEWLAEHHPQQQSWFNSYMAGRQEERPEWFDVYPIQGLIEDIAKHEGVTGSHKLGNEDDRMNTNRETAALSNRARRASEERVFLVDIGGNQGHDLRKLHDKFGAHLPGKLVLQDLPAVLGSSPNTDGIKRIGYNFLDPQPVKGTVFFSIWGNCNFRSTRR